MSTNKTANYQLHLWEPGDDFLRKEFNENNEKLDTALKAQAEELSTAVTDAKQTAASALAAYKTSNDAAVASVRSELAAYKTSNDAAVSVCGNCHVAVGSYVGTGTYGSSSPLTIKLDFDPKALWIFQNNYDSGAFVRYGGTHFAPSSNSIRYFFRGGSAVLAYTYVSGSGYIDTYLYYTMENNTFSCYNTYEAAVQMNTKGTTYYYIAIG